ncbi:MAG: CaiB/BaiF CoA transferase family protein [Alphaproteobacteria bacterium]
MAADTAEPGTPSGPLADVRVLDLSRILAGPWATQILADLGADVIKVERPGKGDDTRGWGPPFYPAGDGSDGDAAYYMAANRNKRSVALDITTEEGQAQVRALARRSDILVENFKTGGLAKYGLDYASLKEVNPALVYCSITGFGHSGPYRHRAGYDYLIQAMGGLMSITGQPEGTPGGEPLKVGVAVSDLFSGMYAVTGILAALHHARRTGEGQHLDVALLDCQAAMLANQAMNYFASGVPPRRMGNAHPNIVPYQVFATADGYVVLAVGNDVQFAALCRVAGAEELARDPAYATNKARVANRTALIEILSELVAGRTSADWLAALEAEGVPCGPINDVAAVFADPQIKAREMVVDQQRDDLGTVRTVGSPLKFSATPVAYRRPPPALGADTGDVLGALAGESAETMPPKRKPGTIT